MNHFFRKVLLVSFIVLSPTLTLTVDAAPPKTRAATSTAAEEARLRELEAEVARRKQAYMQQHSQRRRRIGGTISEPRFEKYLAGFRRKIACSSSLHYPKAARGKTYGDMIVTVSVLADGSFEKATVDRSSGSKVLDRGAIDIARLAAPFEPFPPDIRADTDALDITRTWTFTSQPVEGEALEDPCS